MEIQNSDFITPETENKEKRMDKIRTGRKNTYDRADYFMGIMLLLSARFYVIMLQPRWYGKFLYDNSLVCFTILFLAAGAGYLILNKRKMTRESKISLLFVLACLLWYPMRFMPGKYYGNEQDIAPYVFLFLHVSSVYWVLTLGESRQATELSEKSVIDMLRGFFVLPFINFGHLFGLAAQIFRRISLRYDGGNEERTQKRMQVYVGILASIPVLFIVLPMLSGADKSFAAFLSGIAGVLTGMLGSLFAPDELLYNLLILLIGCYLFGLFWGSFYTKPPKTAKPTELPFAGVITFISIICGVYLLFFIVKLVDAVGIMIFREQTIVYSTYAREGFFELCFIAVLNFCLFYGIKVFADRNHRRIRFALSVLCVQTLFFIALAFSKMSLYISVYGFTFKRVMTSWFMCVLFFQFSLLIKSVRKKSNATRPAVIFASVTFLLLAYSNLDYWVIWLNCRMGVF